MKTILWSLWLPVLLLVACTEQKAKTSQNNTINSVLEIPETVASKSALSYDHKESLWTLNGSPYSGFAISHYADSTLKEKFGILNGKKQNKAVQWFPDGHLKIVANYNKGKLHGEKKIWSADASHVLTAQFNYHTGRAHGEQKKWYPSGELYKKLNLNRGKEEGLQQAFRKNGALYANYEARGGRIFGLKKTALCYGLEDEDIRYKK